MTIGKREAWAWLGVALFFVVQVCAYVRFTLEELFQIYLHMFGAPGMGFYRPASLILTVGAYFWLGRLFPSLLSAPLEAVRTGSFDPSQKRDWRFLLSLNGLFAIIIVEIFLMGGAPNSGGAKFGWMLAVLFVVLFIVGCFIFGSWRNPVPKRTAWPQDSAAIDLSRIVCSVSLWSNCLFLLAVAIYRPYLVSADCRVIGVKLALVGTVIGLFFSRMSRARLSYIIGLLVSILGGVRFGEVAARLTSILFVFVFQLADHRDLKLAATRTWAFGLAQGLGSLIGAVLGFFYIGLEGGLSGLPLGKP